MENLIRIPTENLDYMIQAVLNIRPKASAKLLYHEGEESVFSIRTDSIQDLFEFASEYGKLSVLLYAKERGLYPQDEKENSRQGE